MDNKDQRIEALGYRGEQIICTADEWANGLRTKVQDRAGQWLDQGQDIRAQMALAEVQRLDRKFDGDTP